MADMLEYKIIYLKKRFPLRISRGTMTGSHNLFISYTRDGVTGWGEMAPGETEGADTAEAGMSALQQLSPEDLERKSIHELYDLGRKLELAPCAMAALDMALWDHLAKTARLPLYKLLGLPLPQVPTSVTIGINPPEVIRERIPLLLEGRNIRGLKIKLGSPDGMDADQSMFAQVMESARPYAVKLRVDANGGWSVEQARKMMKWLAQREVEYVEQPLAAGQESELPFLYKQRPLPIFLDESCRFSHDVARFAHSVDGINLKLMKCGGITEALRIIGTARAFGLKTMIGCMGESSLSISAAAAISGAIDYIDLDSHLNLDPDPCRGAILKEGIITPTQESGHGATIINL